MLPSFSALVFLNRNRSSNSVTDQQLDGKGLTEGPIVSGLEPISDALFPCLTWPPSFGGSWTLVGVLRTLMHGTGGYVCIQRGQENWLPHR